MRLNRNGLSYGFSIALLAGLGLAAHATEAGLVTLSQFRTNGDFVVGSNSSRQFGAPTPQGDPFDITIAGIPNGATVQRAWINWSYMTNFPGESTENTITVNGNQVTAAFTDTGTVDLNWGFNYGVGYTADITNLITGNNTYRIGSAVDDPGTGGIGEGATILAVWTMAGAPLKAINVYNGYTSTSTSDCKPTLNFLDPYTGGAANFFVNALDGQSIFTDRFDINGIDSSALVGGAAGNAWQGKTGPGATDNMYDAFSGDIQGARLAVNSTSMNFQTIGFSNGYVLPGTNFTDDIGHTFSALSYTTTVPEPGTLAAWLLGCLLLGVIRIRRPRRSDRKALKTGAAITTGLLLGLCSSAFAGWSVPGNVLRLMKQAAVLQKLHPTSTQIEQTKKASPWTLDVRSLVEEAEKRGERPDFIEAYLHFYQPRAYPYANFDWGQYALANEVRDSLPPAKIPNHSSPNGDVSPTGNWEFLGPRNLDTPFRQYFGLRASSGRISGIAFVPNPRRNSLRANIAYASSAGGGVWRTTDGGANWSQISDSSAQWKSLQAGCVAVTNTNVLNPTSATDIVLVGTGDVRGIYRLYSIGLMRSPDGGTTWDAPRVFNNQPINSIVVDPDDPNKITLCTGGAAVALGSNGNAYPPSSRQDFQGEIWQSTDSGQNWTKVLAIKANWSKLAIGQKDKNGLRWYFAVGINAAGNAVIYRSLQRGQLNSWSALAGPGVNAGSPGVASIQVATSKGNSETVYIMSGQDRNIWQSEKGGNDGTWTSIIAGFPNSYAGGGNDNWGQASYDVSLETTQIPGGYRDVLVVGLISVAAGVRNDATGAWVWADIGQTGTGNSTPANPGGGSNAITHNDQHCCAVNPANPGTLLVGNDGGIYGLTFNWMTLPNPPTVAQLQAAFTFTSTQSATLGVTQFYYGAWHPTNPDVMLGGTQDNATPRSVGPAWAGGNPANLNLWNNCISGGDGNGCAIFMGNGAIQYSSRNAMNNLDRTDNSWTGRVAMPLPTGFANFVPPLFDDVLDNIYVAHTRIYRCPCAGGANPPPGFTGALSPILTAGGANAYVTTIHVALADTNRIYTGSSDGAVWMSQDQGATWVRIDRTAGGAALPNGSPPARWITSIASDPFNPNRIFIGYAGVAAPGGAAVTDHIYRCLDTTETDANRGFSNIDGGGNPLPPVPVNAITVITTPETQRTDTQGRLPNVDIPDNDPNGITDTMNMASTITSIMRVRVKLKISGTFNGDLQVKLTHGGQTAYLMNRVGRTAASNFGYPDDGVDIYLDDLPNAPNGDIHLYQAVTGGNLPAGVPLTGTWQPDGRTAAANVVLDTSPRTAFLSVFGGLAANGNWDLTVSDNAGGDLHHLDQWEVEVTGTTGVPLDIPSTLMVASDSGAFYTENAGGTPADWANATQPVGLPNVQCNDVKYVPGTGFVNVATFGRGMWRIPIGVSSIAGLAGSPYRRSAALGLPITFRVVLARPAPPGGATVAIASSNPAILPIANPQTIVVPAGAITATRNLVPVAPAVPTQVQLSATYGGETRKTSVIISP